MNQEIWKPLVGYEWLYEVSNLWRVKSLFYRKWKCEKILKQRVSRIWYSVIQLKWRKNFYVHRLIWVSFLWLDINNKKQCILHKDDNPLNNSIDNLVIGTHLDNMRDMANKWRNKYPDNSKKIIQFDKENLFIRWWDSLQEAEDELWIHKSWISMCCKWKRKTAGWYNCK